MAHGTTEPTEKYRDATATPISPVCGSMATMENVETGGSDCATAASLATKTLAAKTKIDNRNFLINPSSRTRSGKPKSLALVPSRPFASFAVKFTYATPEHTPAPQSPARQTTQEHT